MFMLNIVATAAILIWATVAPAVATANPPGVPAATPAPRDAAQGPKIVTPKQGPIFAVGGGTTPVAVYQRMLKAARHGKRAVVVVFPQASKKADGSIDRADWFEAGANTVIRVLNLKRKRKAAIAALERADIIWFGGGAQRRLMDALTKANLVTHIRRAHSRGAVVGGTSAGAAVLSEVMISGRNKSGLGRGMPVFKGLGLWPSVVIDQHFVTRKRFGRLFNAVLSHPSKVGIGVGEDTAAVFWPATDEVEVMGGGSVVICDPRTAAASEVKRGKPMASQGLKVHILRAGQRWRLRP